jgi:hypothetical protein
MGGDCKVSLFALFNTLSQKTIMANYPTVKFDWDTVKTTAAVLFVINPLHYNSPEEIESYIVSLTMGELLRRDKNDIPGIFGTGGWYVSFYKCEEGPHELKAEAVLMPFTVKKYLEKTGAM